MKRVIQIALILLVGYSLVGCMSVQRLSDRAIVQAIGVDYVDGEYELTFQLFSTSGSSMGEVGAGTQNASIIVSTGRTIAEAMSQVTRMQGKEMYIGHNKLIVLGYDSLKENPAEYLTYFTNNYNSMHDVHVIATYGKASEIVTAKISQGMLPADAIENMINNSSENGKVKSLKLYELIKDITSGYKSVAIPIISKMQTQQSEDEEKSDTIEEISSLMIDSQGILTAQGELISITTEQTTGYMMLDDSLETLQLSIENSRYKDISLSLYGNTVSVELQQDDGKLTFRYTIKSYGMIQAMQLREGAEQTTIDYISEIQEEVERLLESICVSSFEALTKEYNVDPLELGSILWIEDIDLWREKKENWEEELRDIDVEVDVKLNINRIGLESMFA